MKGINVRIVEKHDGILNLIKNPIDCLVNFDWHSDYPQYSEKSIDVDYFVEQVDPVFYEQNWVAILASQGMVNRFVWIFPHDYNEESYKFFESKNGNSIIINKKFDPSMEIECPYITIDMDFFGSRTPVEWKPEQGRLKLFKEVLGTIKSDDVCIIISKSENYTNYDADQFLQEILTEILCDKRI